MKWSGISLFVIILKKQKNIRYKAVAEQETELREKKWRYVFLFFVAAFVLYWNTIPNKYSLDDNLVVYDHPLVGKGISSIPEIFTSHYRDIDKNVYGYRPIAMTTFAIENEFFGQNPHISHFVNIVLYALLLILLFFLLVRLFQNIPRKIIFFIMLLFAAHPLHTEVVASLKNREELLCFIFGIAAVVFGIRFYSWNYSFIILKTNVPIKDQTTFTSISNSIPNFFFTDSFILHASW